MKKEKYQIISMAFAIYLSTCGYLLAVTYIDNPSIPTFINFILGISLAFSSIYFIAVFFEKKKVEEE